MHTLSPIISDDVLNRIVQTESGGEVKAKARTSSATGLGQFLNATWLACVRTHEPSLMLKRTRTEVLALRFDPAVSLRMLARHTEDNMRALAGANEVGAGDLYLAHFLGAGTARTLLRASEGALVASVVSEKAIKANAGILTGKTCGEVRAWASRKMAKPPARDWVALYAAPPEDRPVASPVHVALDRSDLINQRVDAWRDAFDRPAATVPAAPSQDPFLVLVQRRLKALGYYEVGFIDGRAGSRQAAAIAAFKADRGLAGEAVADDALMTALIAAEAEGFVRPIAAARAEMSERDVAREIPAVEQSRWSRFLAKIGLGTGGTAIGLGTLAEYVDTARDYADPVTRLVAKMPWQLWVAGFLLAFLLIWRSQRAAVKDGVNLVRQGRLT